MQALDTFYSDFDRYPTNEEGLDILASRENDVGEAIISRIPSDPWGHPYEYFAPGRTDPFEIVSYGADHREGGSGADRDIRSDELGDN